MDEINAGMLAVPIYEIVKTIGLAPLSTEAGKAWERLKAKLPGVENANETEIRNSLAKDTDISTEQLEADVTLLAAEIKRATVHQASAAPLASGTLQFAGQINPHSKQVTVLGRLAFPGNCRISSPTDPSSYLDFGVLGGSLKISVTGGEIMNGRRRFEGMERAQATIIDRGLDFHTYQVTPKDGQNCLIGNPLAADNQEGIDDLFDIEWDENEKQISVRGRVTISVDNLTVIDIQGEWTVDENNRAHRKALSEIVLKGALSRSYSLKKRIFEIGKD